MFRVFEKNLPLWGGVGVYADELFEKFWSFILGSHSYVIYNIIYKK